MGGLCQTGRSADGIVVWSATLDQCRPDWLRLLDSDEAARYRSFVSRADRDRFLLGASLARAAVCWAVGAKIEDIALNRTCDWCGGPHGRVRAVGIDAGLSVSHSGNRVLVAVNPSGAVGVDVERVDELREQAGVARRVLCDLEYGAWLALADEARPRALTWYWARKEAALKYTGEGLTVPMRDLHVTDPERPAELIGWARRPDMVAGVTLADLHLDTAYAACLAYPVGCFPVVRPAEQLVGTILG